MNKIIIKILKSISNLLGYEMVRKNVALSFERQSYLESEEFRYILWTDRIYDKILRVPGHVVELGVAYGRNAVLFANHIEMNGDASVRKYFGFDTFDGYTEGDLQNNPQLSEQSWKDTSREMVEERIELAGARRLCSFIEGDLKQTLPTFLEKQPEFRCALLYVDCNAYEPALAGMEIMYKHMMPGGIICIDEKRQGGETKALLEFSEKNHLNIVKDAGPFAVPAYIKIPEIKPVEN